MAGADLKAGRAGLAREEARTIRIEGRDISYLLRRSQRRTLALQIDARGVRVAVPGKARVEEVERFINVHARWLLDKLALRAQQADRPVLALVDGAMIPLLGQGCRLRLGDHGRGTQWRVGDDGVDELHIGAATDPAAAVVRALRQRALSWLGARVVDYCGRLGVAVPPVRLSSARTRWGSCSSVSGIRLHWRLVHMSPVVVDYVVAHEVAHLVHMNHSPGFWAVVESLYPGAKSARLALRHAAQALPEISARTIV
ncbi:MAG: M48 family metallopeptidase [Rhodocyclales bacterium]|nr:M48 family metallopeptidase [Rhodocyclales bacterium]